MCSCHSILECCVMFSGVKLSMGSFVLFGYYATTYVNVFLAPEISLRFSGHFPVFP